PVLDRPPRYRLYVQSRMETLAQQLVDTLRTDLENGLEENPYYRHATGTGQLGVVEVAALDSVGQPAWLVFERHSLAEGRKCGDSKPTALDIRTDWPEWFGPMTVASPSCRR